MKSHQIHCVLILIIISSFSPFILGQDTYAFRYNTGNEGPAQIWREERRQADGTIVGRYGYIDPNGEERVVEYTASKENGFQARGDIGPDAESLRIDRAMKDEHHRATARVMRDWQRAAARTPPAPVQADWNNQQWNPQWNSQPSQQPAAANNWNNRQQQPAQPAQNNWNARSGNSWPASATTSMWNSAWSDNNWNLNNQKNTFPEWQNRPARSGSWNTAPTNTWNTQRRSSPANIQRRTSAPAAPPAPVAAPVSNSNFDWPETNSGTSNFDDSADESTNNNNNNNNNAATVRSSSPFHYSFEINHADGKSTSFSTIQGPSSSSN